MTSSPGAGSSFDYLITLDNSPASTSPIGTFWYAWSTAGYNFLPHSPTMVTAPAGWNESVSQNGANDGYGIQFVASAPSYDIQPGSSLNFSFVSPDSPAALAGNSPYHGGTTPVGTSFLYQGLPFVGASAQLIVMPVPEPSSLALLIFGAFGLLLARFRLGASLKASHSFEP